MPISNCTDSDVGYTVNNPGSRDGGRRIDGVLPPRTYTESHPAFREPSSTVIFCQPNNAAEVLCVSDAVGGGDSHVILMRDGEGYHAAAVKLHRWLRAVGGGSA